MADSITVHEAIVAALRASLPAEVTVYEGTVPDRVPEDAAGYIRPYVVLFTGSGGDLPEERDLSRLADSSTRDTPAQTSCVGASVGHVLRLTEDVRKALLNLPVGNGWLKPTGYDVAFPLADNQASPARLFLPLQWRLLTN